MTGMDPNGGESFMGVHDGHREKMRQRYLNSGLDSFAEHEALELLLFYAIPRKDTNVLAHQMIERYGSLYGVLSAPVEDLVKFPGVGERTAVLLHLAPEIYRKARLEAASRDTPLNSVERVGAYLLERFTGERNEVVYQLCLDRKGKLLACKRLAEGGLTATALNIRTVVEHAALTAASTVILAHNHPSGVALPSAEDLATTRQIQLALDAIGIPLTDHIIVADGDYISFAQSGYLIEN